MKKLLCKYIRKGGVILLSLLFAAIGVKFRSKWMDYRQANDMMVQGLYEAYAMGHKTVSLDTTALRVLCLGNSITHHPPLKGDLPGADSLWRGDWGMCASRPELDYVHQLEAMFRQYNDSTTFTRKNIWEWEKNFAVNKDSLFGDICRDKDLIILKIGENVQKENEAGYRKAFDELIVYCLQYTPNVIIAGCYWKAPVKEQAMISAARCHRLPYVPLFWIYESYRDAVLAHVGDTILDARLQSYPITTDFICTHPNDEGMRMIAEAIFGVVKLTE